MSSDKINITNFWFLIALFVLLINDFFLKACIGNWVTGKLSDFAGLFVFYVFLTYLFPRYKRSIFLGTAILFTVWKSPYSQPIIDYWNLLPVFDVSRVVDYSDLLALLVLPVAYWFVLNGHRLRWVRLSPVIPILMSVFAIVATSVSPGTDFSNNPVEYLVKIDDKEQFIQRLEENYIELQHSHNSTEGGIWEMHNLNDSITSVWILIHDEPIAPGTLRIALTHWQNRKTSHSGNVIRGSVQKDQQLVVRRAFEAIVFPLFEIVP